MKNQWVQGIKIKEGSLHGQLEIPVNTKIPITLLHKIKSTSIGTTIRNPTRVGKSTIPVTPLLKHRVMFYLNISHK